jgi:hypothetical protein
VQLIAAARTFAMTPDTSDLARFFQTNLVQLDEAIEGLVAELRSLRDSQILPDPGFADRFAEARRTAEEIRNKVSTLARVLCREVPSWSDRAGLEALLRDLLEAQADHDRLRRRLQRIAGQLQGGQFIHKLRGAAERLNGARLKAAAELLQKAAAAQPSLLPGPDDHSDWLTWAWSLEAEALDGLSAQVQPAYPALADLLPEAERWQPGPRSASAAAPEVGGAVEPCMSAVPRQAEPSPVQPLEPPAVQPQPLVESTAPLTAANPLPPQTVSSPDSSTAGMEETVAVAPDPFAVPMVEVVEAFPPVGTPVLFPQSPAEQPDHGIAPPAFDGYAPHQSREVPEALRRVASPACEIEPATPVPSVVAPERLAADRALLWRLIEQDRVGLAYHLALCLHQLVPGADCLPADLPRAIALGPLVTSSSGEMVEDLTECVSSLQDYVMEHEGDRGEEAHALRVLLLIAMLRPALLAPTSTAGALLAALVEEDSSVAPLGRTVLDYTSFGQGMTPALLSGVCAHAAWEDKVRQVREAARTWLADNRQCQLIYAHTTTAWREWLREGGMLSAPLAAIIEDDREGAEGVRKAVKFWSVKRDVDKLLARTDEQLRKGGARQRPIHARAQTAVFEHAQGFVELGQRWLDLIAAEPSDANDYRFRQANECRARLQALLKPARLALGELASAGGNDASSRAASAAALRLLDDLARLIEPGAQEGSPAPPPRYVLHRELLGLPWLVLNDRWEPQESDLERLLGELERLAAAPPADLRQAFAARTEARDFRAADWALDGLLWGGAAEAELQELKAQIEQQLQQRRLALRRKVEETRDNIERAVCYDLIDEATRLDYLARVESVAVDEVLVFGPEETGLCQIDETLAARRAERIREVEESPALADIARQHPEVHERIQSALLRHDFLTAEEYIRLTQDGQVLDEAAESDRDILGEFFPDFTSRLHEFFSGGAAPDLRQLIDDVRAGRSVGPRSMGGVPAPQAGEAANMLQAWFRLKDRRSPEASLRGLLTGFGFKVADVQPVGGVEAPHWLADVRTEPLVDRGDCLVSHFGSLAKGQYRVLCLYDRPPEDRIVELARKCSPHGPVLVLYLGRMTEQRRRDLAEMCWRKHRTFLVIDEALVFFLCGERFNRLPVLFGCAFPFTVAEPYTTTSSLVAVEMFYGRDREREAVIDRFGSNLVYGGRQLGKTALLRDVERRYHDPGHGVIVRYIDLTHGESIGVSRPAEDVWVVLGHALAAEKVLSQARSNPRSLADGVKEWLGKDDRRRVVLLLDEADAFLDSDSRKVAQQSGPTFPNVSGLKMIMDATDRRFKVVFAGLHNVQRTAHDPNSPIAHLGPHLYRPVAGARRVARGAGPGRAAAAKPRLPLRVG